MLIYVSDRKPTGKGKKKYYREYDIGLCRVVCVSKKAEKLRYKKKAGIIREITGDDKSYILCMSDRLPIQNRCDSEETVCREMIDYYVGTCVGSDRTLCICDRIGIATDSVLEKGRRCRKVVVCCDTGAYDYIADRLYNDYGVCTTFVDSLYGKTDVRDVVNLLKNDIFYEIEDCKVKTLHILRQTGDRGHIYKCIAEKCNAFTDLEK